MFYDKNSPLHDAIRACNLQDVQEMLSKGADVDAADCCTIRPIHIAAGHGYLNILEALIARGCDVNAHTCWVKPYGRVMSWGMTALHAAADKADPNIVLSLIRAGANVNVKNNISGRYPLHIAAEYGRLSIVKALVAANADVNAQDTNTNESNFNDTPLICAVRGDFEDVAKFLVQNGAVVNATNASLWTPLHSAAAKGNVNITKLLIENKAAVNAKTLQGWTPLHMASEIAVSQFLINSGADVNVRDKDGYTPLLSAAQRRYPAETSEILRSLAETVSLLLSKGARVNARAPNGRTPLHFAASNDYTDVVKILIENKADVNAVDDEMWTSLHFAADKWHVEVVKYLLAEGADVNSLNKAKSTPLHLAAGGFAEKCSVNEFGPLDLQYQCDDSKLNTMKALVENGADINAKDVEDKTALHKTCYDLRAARYLLENGVFYDVKALTPFRILACLKDGEHVAALLVTIGKLFKAVKEAKCAEIEKCIQEGAPINCRSIKYGTPLMYACWKGHLAEVNVLLKNGADINLSNSNGVTPLHYAAKFGHYEILCALLQQGAVYNARTKTGKKTPLHFAQEGGKKEVTETLELIERMFIRLNESDDTLLKLKDINSDKFSAMKNCKNVNEETLIQMASKNGYDELCKLLYDL